ncbi:MAG: hypothetical protein QOG12_1357 [Verrucomicrobiota bacterium]
MMIVAIVLLAIVVAGTVAAIVVFVRVAIAEQRGAIARRASPSAIQIPLDELASYLVYQTEMQRSNPPPTAFGKFLHEVYETAQINPPYRLRLDDKNQLAPQNYLALITSPHAARAERESVESTAKR